MTPGVFHAVTRITRSNATSGDGASHKADASHSNAFDLSVNCPFWQFSDQRRWVFDKKGVGRIFNNLQIMG